MTHVDDFYIAGTPDFVKRIIDHIGRELTVSKIEEDCFRFTGLDIKNTASWSSFVICSVAGSYLS